MNEWQNDLEFLRSTGAEADRFLKSLEAESEQIRQHHVQEQKFQSQQVESQPIVSAKHALSLKREEDNSGTTVLIISVILAPFFLFWIWQTNSQDSRSTVPPLSYSASCGSPAGANKRWWPVLGTANRQLLQTIRNHYCGDAYINAEGVLQVASFDSWNGAEAFRLQLEAATSSSFRVGRGHD